MKRTPSLVILPCLLAALASAPLAAQSRSLETRLFSLVGSPAAPHTEGEGSLVLVETYDASGRLVSVGRAPAKKDATAAIGDGSSKAVPAPSASSPRPGAVPAPAAGRQSSTASPSVAAPGTAAKSAPRDELEFLDLRYDARGRITELAYRTGLAEAARRARRFYDAESRPSSIELWEKGKLVELLSLTYAGSGSQASASLRDATGQALAEARLSFGGGGADGLTTELSFLDAAGSDAGGLSLAWDAAGRLVQWEARAAAKQAGTEKAAPAPAGAGPAGASATPRTEIPQAEAGAGGVSAGESLPGIAELLFPSWPEDPASIELAALLAAPGRRQDFSALRASGLVGLPFARPDEGRADFLWDSAGRLLRARLFDAAGSLEASLDCRYDEGGRLVEESILEAAGVGGGETRSVVHAYRLDAKGGWTARSSFRRVAAPGIGGLEPLDYRERLVTTRR